MTGLSADSSPYHRPGFNRRYFFGLLQTPFRALQTHPAHPYRPPRAHKKKAFHISRSCLDIFSPIIIGLVVKSRIYGHPAIRMFYTLRSHNIWVRSWACSRWEAHFVPFPITPIQVSLFRGAPKNPTQNASTMVDRRVKICQKSVVFRGHNAHQLSV